MEDEELWMIRESLDGLPDLAPSAGFSIRWHQPGDEAVWVALQAPFYDPGAITLDSFYRWFGTDAEAYSRRIAYLLDGTEQAIGTAAAWSYDGYRGPEWGRVHWVAVAEGYQRRGLGKVLMSAVLRRMAELGHTKAYLTTSRDRPHAVSLYRFFGFVEL